MDFQLMYNNAAGDYYVNSGNEEDFSRQEGYFSEVGFFRSREELDEEIERWRRETTVYAVFENNAAGEVFMSAEDALSGNWRGSKYGYFTLVIEYETKEEAESHVARTREYYRQLARSLCK